jgi:hypothetical protein
MSNTDPTIYTVKSDKSLGSGRGKIQWSKGQTMIHRTLHRIHKIDHEPINNIILSCYIEFISTFFFSLKVYPQNYLKI